MRFPNWASGNPKNRVKFLISLMALEASPAGNMAELSKLSGVQYPTLLWALGNKVSPTVAEKLVAAVPNCGVKPYWLTNPEWIVVDSETGDVIE